MPKHIILVEYDTNFQSSTSEAIDRMKTVNFDMVPGFDPPGTSPCERQHCVPITIEEADAKYRLTQGATG